MIKKFKDKDRYEEILYALNEAGINEEIISLALKMDINLAKLFDEKIINANENDIKNNISVVSKNLLGVYGNYLATNYYKGLGYKTENEYEVCDKNGKLVTKADIYFMDKDGKKNFCEVKTTPQIIDNIRNYVDDSNLLKGSFIDKDNEILKYKNIGKKLLKQVEKLSFDNNIVNVIIFNGCYIDDIILNALNEKKVVIRKLAISVEELEKTVIQVVYKVLNEYNKTFEKNNNFIY